MHGISFSAIRSIQCLGCSNQKYQLWLISIVSQLNLCIFQQPYCPLFAYNFQSHDFCWRWCVFTIFHSTLLRECSDINLSELNLIIVTAQMSGCACFVNFLRFSFPLNCDICISLSLSIHFHLVANEIIHISSINSNGIICAGSFLCVSLLSAFSLCEFVQISKSF